MVPSRTRVKRSGKTLPVAIGLAAGVTAAAVFVELQKRRAEAQHPPAGRFVDVAGTRVHYIEKGQGTPVVLIHGAGVTAEDYVASGLVDQLAPHHRVVAFDRPGYGYSDRRGKGWSAKAQAELLLEACTTLGIDRAIVVGHSWGTFVALEMALHYPKRLHGLVLISGYYFPTPRIDSLLLGAPAIPIAGSIMVHTISPLLGRLLVPGMVRRMFAPNPVPQAFHSNVPLSIMLRPKQLRSSAQDAARMVPTAAELEAGYNALRGLRITILAGNEDQIVGPEGQSSRLAEAIPDCEYEAIPGAGHMLHHSYVHRVVDAVSRLSKEVLPEPQS